MATPTGEPAHGKDWYLREWMIARGRIQAEISRDLGWDRGRVSKVYNGRQPYGRADVVQLAEWLGIEPFELLMPPNRALALRNFEIAAAQIVAENEQPAFDHGNRGVGQAPAEPRHSAVTSSRRSPAPPSRVADRRG